jgi:uncharacterized protein (TIGR02266 family)
MTIDDTTSEPEVVPKVKISGGDGDDATYAPYINLFGGEIEEDGGERRGTDRLAYDVAVYVRNDEHEIVGLCGDISPGGLFVTTREHIPRGSLVELEVLLPDSDEALTLEAEVRWTREQWDEESKVVPGLGVKFIDVTDDDRESISRIIEAVGGPEP